MGRPRVFDHDEASRLRWAEGWSVARLAERYGVAKNSVLRATDARVRARHAREQRERKAWRSGECSDCGGACTEGGQRCQRCHANHARANAPSVRPDTLRCNSRLHEGERWLADDAFPHRAQAPARRYRHSECHACAARRKRWLRARQRAERVAAWV
jgi:hypothetical protein